jgi:hypothetical protein
MRDWFEALWLDAVAIDQSDIDTAKERWLEHRKNRLFFHAKNKRLSFIEALKLDQTMFRDRNIFLTISVHEMSEEAKQELATVKAREPLFSNVITAYENWPDIPYNATLIDLYLEDGIRNAKFLEISRSPDRKDDPLFKLKVPKELFLCYKEKNIFGFKISKEDKKYLSSKVKELWSAEMTTGDEDARIIPIEKAFEILI